MGRVLVSIHPDETSEDALAFRDYLLHPHFSAGVTFGAERVVEFGADPYGPLWQKFETFTGLILIVGPRGLDESPAGRLGLQAARRASLPIFIAQAESAPIPDELSDLETFPANFRKLDDQQKLTVAQNTVLFAFYDLIFEDRFARMAVENDAEDETIRIEQSAIEISEPDFSLGLHVSEDEESTDENAEELLSDLDQDPSGDTFNPMADQFRTDMEELAPPNPEEEPEDEDPNLIPDGEPRTDEYALGDLASYDLDLAEDSDEALDQYHGPTPAEIEAELEAAGHDIDSLDDPAGLGDLEEFDDLEESDEGEEPVELSEDELSNVVADVDTDADDESEYAAAAGGDASADLSLDEADGSLQQDEIDMLLLGDMSDIGEDDYVPLSGGGTGDRQSTLEQNELSLETSPEPDPVQFDAYFPPEARVGGRYALFVYALVAEEAMRTEVARDVERFRDDLGGEVPAPRQAKKQALLKHGTQVAVVPECESVRFEPERLEKRWQGDWTRFAFDFRPTEEAADETALCRVSIQVAGIEIAHINCAFEILSTASAEPPEAMNHDAMTMAMSAAPMTENEPAPNANPQPDASMNPLALARSGDWLSQSTRPYQHIFVSYSRRDFEVTRAYRDAQAALGNTVFVDTESIRAGEDWRAALARAIDSADVFQLFWSRNSARSENVRDEWDYALKHRCPEDACAAFIRPVYWKEPPPSPPEELAHLHFKYVPLG